jgi:hypothetical protein
MLCNNCLLTCLVQYIRLFKDRTAQLMFDTDISGRLMATDKRIGPCNTHRVRLLYTRGLNEFSTFFASNLVQEIRVCFAQTKSTSCEPLEHRSMATIDCHNCEARGSTFFFCGKVADCIRLLHVVVHVSFIMGGKL